MDEYEDYIPNENTVRVSNRTWRLLNQGIPMQKPFKMPNDMLDELERESQAAVQPRLPLLEERQHTHGTFEDNAIISQSFKRMFRAGPGWNQLSDIEREAMDMIALKFSRILSGKSMSKQHWEDVVGYAKLVEEKCF